jgi:hypothetical protein
MRLSFAILLIAVACIVAMAQAPLPRITAADPNTGKVGDLVTLTGENLGKDSVAKVFLTDGDKVDIVVEVTEQTATTIKFKIPAKATGRMRLMVQTAEPDPRQMVLPTRVTVE